MIVALDLEGIVQQLGYHTLGPASTVEEARSFAMAGNIDFAILDDSDQCFLMELQSRDQELHYLRFGKPTSGQHYLIAHMRAAAVVLQPKALFIQRKVP